MSCSCTDLNVYFGVRDIPDDQYTRFASGELDHDTIKASLCAPGTIRANPGDEKSSVLAGKLRKKAKVWLNFVMAKLLPTTHVTEVTIERLIFVFALISGLSIDVGRIIHEQIYNSANFDR